MLLIDGSHLLHRQLHTPNLYDLQNSSGLRVGGITGVFSSLDKMARQFPGHGMLIAWDLGCSTFRREIFPEYKEGSSSLADPFVPAESDAVPEMDEWDEVYFMSRQMLHQKLLPYCNLTSIQIYGIEADDIIAWCCRFVDKGEHLIIVSTDGDFFQLIDDNVDCYNPITSSTLYKDELIKQWNLIPEQYKEHYIWARALSGDGDAPGIVGIGGTRGVQIGRTILEEGWSAIEGRTVAQANAIKYREIAERNKILMDLNLHIPDNVLNDIKEHIELLVQIPMDDMSTSIVHNYLHKLECPKARTMVDPITDNNLKSDYKDLLKQAVINYATLAQSTT